MSVQKWNKVILFGDSLTQRSMEPLDGCWGSLLADRLQRISDVIVRGFSGYNSRWLRLIVDQIFGQTIDGRDVSCVTILLGANDSCDPNSGSGQHVPIEEFEHNLTAIIDHLESIGITRERILLISPPIYCRQKHLDFCQLNGKTIPIKDNQTVAKYAEAVGRMADKSGVEFIDLYQHFAKHHNSEQLLCDGLHFSRNGSQLLFELIWPSIETKIKFYTQCSQLVPNYPLWSEIQTKNPEKSLFE